MNDRHIKDFFDRSSETFNLISKNCIEDIKSIVNIIVDALKKSNKLLLCGNGGSAADCQHIATELVVRLSSKFERKALPAVTLTTNTSTLTAAGNDYGFEFIFSRQVEAFGIEGDVLLAFSTSGNSKNIIEAVKTAKSIGMKTVGFLGGSGGKLVDMVDASVVIPDKETMFIQQGHGAVGHLMCDLIEIELLGK